MSAFYLVNFTWPLMHISISIFHFELSKINNDNYHIIEFSLLNKSKGWIIFNLVLALVNNWTQDFQSNSPVLLSSHCNGAVV